MTVPAGFTLEAPAPPKEKPPSLPKGFVLEDTPAAPPPEPDFSKNTKGEGLYSMKSPKGELKSIPYSNIMPAYQAGYMITPADRELYAEHRKAEVLKTQPNISEPEYLKAMALPTAAPEKPGLWDKFGNWFQKKTEPTTDGLTMLGGPHPGMAEANINVAKRVGRVLFGIPDMGVQGYRALKDAMSADPQKAMDGEARLLTMHPGAQVVNRVKELRDDWQRDPKLALENVAGDALGMWLADKITAAPLKGAKGLSEWRSGVENQYRPISTRLAGVDIPVSVGEEFPDLPAGHKFAELKGKGVNAPKFRLFERRQQMAVKELIRRTAQEVAGRVISNKEPAAAMTDAAEATFQKARPLYRALDGTMAKGTFDLASSITKRAIARAEKLGLKIDLEPRVVDTKTGLPVDPSLSPQQIQAGIKLGEFHEEIPAQQPLTTFVKVTSELKKMQRMSADPAVRYAIGQDIEGLNTTMETALQGTPQFDNWKEAGRLWKKGYALRSVAKEIKVATKGTPPQAQVPGMGTRPTRLVSLASKLTKLADSGTLRDAFTPDQINNLRDAADILDRAQSVRIGKGSTGSLAHALGGGKTSAAVGAAAGAIHGGVPGAAMGAAMGWAGGAGATGLLDFLRSKSESWLVNVMTDPESVGAMRLIEQANTVRQLNAAMMALKAATRTAAVTSAAQQKTKSLLELKSEARRRNPADVQ